MSISLLGSMRNGFCSLSHDPGSNRIDAEPSNTAQGHTSLVNREPREPLAIRKDGGMKLDEAELRDQASDTSWR